MKKIAFSLLILLSLVLTSCFDVFNNITIKEDGSGEMSTRVDMGSIMGMLAGMGGMGEEKIKMDTSFVLGSMVDSAEGLTAEEKDLFRKASVAMTMDSEGGEFEMTITTPFRNLEDMNKIREAMKKSDFLGKSLGKLGEKNSPKEEEEEMNPFKGMAIGGKEPGIPSPDEYFQLHFEKGKITRKQIGEKIADLAGDELLSKMKEAIDQGLPAMRSVYTITLPKPVKKAEGKNVVLSDDKKTVTIENTLDELFDDPSKFEFEIEF